MKVLGPKTALAILLAAMLCACIILAIEVESVNFFHMLLGFVLAFVMGAVILYLRWAPIVFVTAVVFILGSYLAIHYEATSMVWGAIPGVATVMVFQFGWIGPHRKDSFKHDDYARQQKEIYEKEKSGGEQSYAEQQKAQYEKEKAEKEAGEKKDGPPGE